MKKNKWFSKEFWKIYIFIAIIFEYIMFKINGLDIIILLISPFVSIILTIIFIIAHVLIEQTFFR